MASILLLLLLLTPDDILNRVASIHGNPGVFATAGFRMGSRALTELHLAHGSFALEVTHRTPLKVQYSCIADGLQAATGVSAGKLNLHVVEGELETVVLDRKSGTRVVFHLRPEFLRRYLDTPYDHQQAAARAVAQAPDEEIFEFEVLR